MSSRKWRRRIEDILAAIAEIQAFSAGATLEQFRTDAKTLKAVSADLIIIGEAANHIPDDVQDANQDVPWAVPAAAQLLTDNAFVTKTTTRTGKSTMFVETARLRGTARTYALFASVIDRFNQPRSSHRRLTVDSRSPSPAVLDTKADAPTSNDRCLTSGSFIAVNTMTFVSGFTCVI